MSRETKSKNFEPRKRPLPRGEGSGLSSGDAYLYESFAVGLGEPEAEAVRRGKLAKLAPARELGVRLYGVTTSISADPPPRANNDRSPRATCSGRH